MAKESLVSKNELRVGNLVLCKDKVTEVESIYEQGINLYISGDYYGAWKCDYDGYFTYDWFEGALIEPIPLTEEWLLKFGFENKAEIQPPDYFLNYVPIRFQYDVGWYDLGYDGIYHKIKFVHQLQNLYFALTGNELTLTPAKEEIK